MKTASSGLRQTNRAGVEPTGSKRVLSIHSMLQKINIASCQKDIPGPFSYTPLTCSVYQSLSNQLCLQLWRSPLKPLLKDFVDCCLMEQDYAQSFHPLACFGGGCSLIPATDPALGFVPIKQLASHAGQIHFTSCLSYGVSIDGSRGRTPFP